MSSPKPAHAAASTNDVSGRIALKGFTNQWFHDALSWQIPKVSEQAALPQETHKSAISKAIISLRQGLESNGEAIKKFEGASNALVKAQLDYVALKYGYMPENQTEAITTKKDQAIASYKAVVDTLTKLNQHMGTRVTAAVFLLPIEADKNQAQKDLTVLRFIKSIEPYTLQALLKCDILKSALLMYKELKREKYKTVIAGLDKELTQYEAKIASTLEKIAGTYQGMDIKAMLQESAAGKPKQDPNVYLLSRLESLTALAKEINTITSARLAHVAIDSEKANNIMSIVPTHKAPDPF